MTLGYGFAYDDVGTVCKSTKRAGTFALGEHLKAKFGLPLVGYYNCRPSTGGSGLSTHAVWRGIDAHVHLRGIEDPPVGDELTTLLAIADYCVENAEQLGVQRVIRLDKEWDSRPGQRWWSPYTSGLFHGNHAHIELCEAASFNLTAADIESLEDDLTPEQLRAELDAHDLKWLGVDGNQGQNMLGSISDVVKIGVAMTLAGIPAATVDVDGLAAAIKDNLAAEVVAELAEKLSA